MVAEAGGDSGSLNLVTAVFREHQIHMVYKV
jgi:hypothetical protein